MRDTSSPFLGGWGVLGTRRGTLQTLSVVTRSRPGAPATWPLFPLPLWSCSVLDESSLLAGPKTICYFVETFGLVLWYLLDT